MPLLASYTTAQEPLNRRDERNVKGLRDKLVEEGVDAPTYGTLRHWSAAGQWKQRAIEHDSGIVITVDHIMEQKAETRVELSELAEKAAANAKAPPKKGVGYYKKLQSGRPSTTGGGPSY